MTRAGWRRACVLATVWLAWAGCTESGAPPARAAPPLPRAGWVIEPARIGIGEVAVIELAVTTPPEHSVHPFAPPRAVEGFWLLDAQRQPVEKEVSRWIHRTRLRVRARAVGEFVWPAAAVEVEAPDGARTRVPLDPLSIEVASVLADFPDRVAPFGPRAPPPPENASSQAAAAVAGALSALAAVGLVALLRRRGRADRRQPADAPVAPPGASWIRATAELAAARADAEGNPVAAADAVAAALRRYMARRFRADAEVRTTEELADAKPPFAATSSWPVFVELLRQLDALRFPPPGDASRRRDGAQRLRALFDDADRFVADTTPPPAQQ